MSLGWNEDGTKVVCLDDPCDDITVTQCEDHTFTQSRGWDESGTKKECYPNK